MLDDFNQCIEKPTCFSHSKLWDFVKTFYQSSGLEAWDQKVPYLVTNARTTAKHHAHMILQHAKGPYAIIDYGAGLGQHTHYLLQYLQELAPWYEKPLDWFSVYLADISEASQKAWESHPDLKPHFESGKLHAILLSGDWVSDVALLPKAPQHCLIANYLLDSMPFEAFENGTAIGLSLYTKRKHLPNPALDEIILKPKAISKPHPYPVLEERYGTLRHTVPTTAIRFIESYFKNTQDALMIINDKMFPKQTDIDYDNIFNLTLEGCYSSTLNLDAILITLRHLFHNVTDHNPRLQTAVLAHHPIGIPSTLTCSDTASLFAFYKQLNAIPAQYALTLAKTLDYDPFCLEILSQSIVPDHTPASDLQTLIEACQQHTFQGAHGFSDLHAGKILRQCSAYLLAHEYLDRYQKSHGDHPAYWLEKGILLHQSGESEKAHRFLTLAAQDPLTESPAKQLLSELSIE